MPVLLTQIYPRNGNPGIADHATVVDLDPADHRAVIDFVRRHQIGLVVVGPEAPLVEGLADNVRAIGVPVFGPGREAARLEGSKGFTKDLCARVGIPTAGYSRVTSRDGALACLDDFATAAGCRCVIKADGLAAGKGVIVTESRDAALEHASAFLPSGPVLIEEFLSGPEVSLFFLSDGDTVVLVVNATHAVLEDVLGEDTAVPTHFEDLAHHVAGEFGVSLHRNHLPRHVYGLHGTNVCAG